MSERYERETKILELKDLGPASGFHDQPPLCNKSPIRFGIKHDGIIVEWCTECGYVRYPASLSFCPNCKLKIKYKDTRDKHIAKIDGKLRVVCR